MYGLEERESTSSSTVTDDQAEREYVKRAHVGDTKEWLGWMMLPGQTKFFAHSVHFKGWLEDDVVSLVNADGTRQYPVDLPDLYHVIFTAMGENMASYKWIQDKYVYKIVDDKVLIGQLAIIDFAQAEPVADFIRSYQ